jgi:hypothetical protein
MSPVKSHEHQNKFKKNKKLRVPLLALFDRKESSGAETL